MAKRRAWVPIAAGSAVLLAFVALGGVIAGVSWMRSHLDVSDGAAAPAAERAFAEVRSRFPDPTPLLELDEGGRPRYVGGAPAVRPDPGEVTALHVIAWSPRDSRLIRVEFPYWLVRLKRGPIRVGARANGLDSAGLDLDPAEVERFGPGILFDAVTPKGQHVLVWTH